MICKACNKPIDNNNGYHVLEQGAGNGGDYHHHCDYKAVTQMKIEQLNAKTQPKSQRIKRLALDAAFLTAWAILLYSMI